MLDASILKDYDIEILIRHIEEKIATNSSLNDVFSLVPLEVYGFLQFHHNSTARISDRLPRMPSKEEQEKWTGTSGNQLIDVAANYVKSLIGYASTLTGKPADNLNFLDHGCGWGRIPRLISRFIPENRIYGFDPMQDSIDICHRDNVPGTYKLCDAYPDSLPVDDGVKFDLINVFSVFTHLNEDYQFQLLKVLRKYVSNQGVLAATIRREVFWDAPRFNNSQRQYLKQEHRQNGFAHLVGGNLGLTKEEAFFGDTSTSIRYVEENWKDWKLVATDINASQPAQIVLYLKPV